jgi:endonuclease G
MKLKTLLIIPILSSSIFAFNATEYVSNDHCDQLIVNPYFKVCYDYKLMGTKAVSYTLDGEKVNKINIKKRPSFHTEKSLDREYRVSPKSYSKTGYDRGHMANDASFDWSMESLNSTYTMANIIPQEPRVNRYHWIKVERYARMVARKLGSLNVLNIMRYSSNPKRLKKQNIAIPKGFYKILYNKAKNFERCFYYKNDTSTYPKKDKLKRHLIECSLIEPTLLYPY